MAWRGHWSYRNQPCLTDLLSSVVPETSCPVVFSPEVKKAMRVLWGAVKGGASGILGDRLSQAEGINTVGTSRQGCVSILSGRPSI